MLLDENLSRRIVPFLETDYSGSTQVTLIGMERASDEEIWHYAKDNGFCIVTKDADFYDLGLVKGAPPKVSWLKSGSVAKSAVVQALVANKSRLQQMSAAPGTPPASNCIDDGLRSTHPQLPATLRRRRAQWGRPLASRCQICSMVNPKGIWLAWMVSGIKAA